MTTDSVHDGHCGALLLDRVFQHSNESRREKAVVSWDAELTYGELRRQIDSIAATLARQGIGRGHVVAVYMARSAAAIVSLLGIMRCGAAYTVAEHDGNEVESPARLKAVAPDLVITREGTSGQVRRAGIRSIVYEEAVSGAPGSMSEEDPVAGDVAYVLYTSGSTGVPKGVEVSHANIRHYAESILERLELHRPLRYAHASALSADLGNTSLLLSLWTGGTLYVISEEVRRDARAFGEYVQSRSIDFLKITPSHFSALFRGLIERRSPRAMFEYLVLGGEALSVGLADEILASGIARTLVNHYGPTEATVGVTVHVMRDRADLLRLSGNTVPIGRAFGRTRLYVRTETGTLESRGARGELYIGGPSVALGYLNDEAGTRERFVTGIEGDLRFYRTGDLCQVSDDGVVEFLGRLDRQVKINGYRVELDHIAAVLCALPKVRGAKVFFLRETKKPLLAAAYLAEDEIQEDSLFDGLRAWLPGYMVPSRLIRFEEFPLNPNGKVDIDLLETAVVEVLTDEETLAGRPLASPVRHTDDPVHAHVVEAWQTHLRHGRFGDESDFFMAGGDSITAIQVISDLQVRGYSLTPTQFSSQPTVRALVGVIRANDAIAGGETVQLLTSSTEFSAAQRWFFRQDFAQSDHWNQCLLLQSDAAVDEKTLEKALRSVLALHPMLRCCYRRTERGWEARTIELPASSSCLSVQSMEHGEAAAETVKQTSEELNRRINLASGDLFKVCLLKAAHGRDQLLVVCHHLSVDAVSWRIIIDDLIRFYSAFSRNQTLSIPSSSTGFWEWVLHVKQRRAELETDLDFWRQSGFVARPSVNEETPPGENREELASTIWIRFSAEETELLSSRLLPSVDTQAHIALLGAFAHAYGKVAGKDSLLVDVESHGRTSFQEGIDVSRVVGWFTSTFPVRLEVTGRGAHECIAEAGRALTSVPNLGMAYGELQGESAWEGLEATRAEICYNYLGDFHFRHDDRLRLTVSRHPLGPARGPENDRVYDLRLTARTVNGELAVDLSFSRARHDLDGMRRLLRETKEALLREIGVSPTPEPDPVVEDWSSSGLLTYVPDALRLEAAAPRQKSYRHVLLTGATGYIGVHVLHELLRQTGAQIHCLVRGSDLDSARAKLADAYRHYMGCEEALDFQRITVLLGDIATPRLGLPDDAFRDLAIRLDAIYHFAADTRLFGPAERFEHHNVDAVRWLIRLASTYRAKDLHHMSTLAVAGVNRSDELKVFSELCLDIGQDFQNEYERSKFQAEKLVFQFKAEGGSAYIYRSGNVSGRLDTAQFQRNAADNRLVQLLRAICKAGKLPEMIGEDIALSPVDVVAHAIVRISLDSGLTAGVFHVDTTHAVPFASILGQLQEIGFHLEGTNEKSFRTVFEGLDTSQDPDLALGLFWMSRSSRNIVFVHDNTHRLLSEMGCAIPPLDREWLRLYLSRLVQDSVLKPLDGRVVGAA